MAVQVETEGNTVDEAIDKALETLGIAREQAEVEILQEGRRNLLGFGRRKARVRVNVRRPLSAPEEAPLPDHPGTGAAEPRDAAEVLRGILERMGVEGTVEVSQDEASGQTSLRVSSDSGALLIGRHGQTLDALEYLVNRIAGRQEERGSRIQVDVEGYRERREHELREMALRMAERAKERGRPESTEPMSPRDRRIVHLALSDAPGITTRSVGQGHFRRIVISAGRK